MRSNAQSKQNFSLLPLIDQILSEISKFILPSSANNANHTLENIDPPKKLYN